MRLKRSPLMNAYLGTRYLGRHLSEGRRLRALVETAARLTPQPRRPSGHGPSPLEPAALDKRSHDPQRFSSLTLERAQVRSAPRNFTRPFNASHLKPSTSRQVHCLTQTRQNGERERRDRRSVRIYLSISVLSCVKGGGCFSRVFAEFAAALFYSCVSWIP